MRLAENAVQEGLHMDSLPPPARRTGGRVMHNLTWSHAEKVIAREAFRRALEREFQLACEKPGRWPKTSSNPRIFGNWKTTSPVAARRSTANTTTGIRFCRTFLEILSAVAASAWKSYTGYGKTSWKRFDPVSGLFDTLDAA
jgi:hypothetical protein